MFDKKSISWSRQSRPVKSKLVLAIWPPEFSRFRAFQTEFETMSDITHLSVEFLREDAGQTFRNPHPFALFLAFPRKATITWNVFADIKLNWYLVTKY
jgi:hypothetical protein